ncbi:hypothetical protein C8F01DRAFT_1082312 [Mycena amicta]|nr:hypothetical protein C8F01DRAFT_1082312 [Mycena amicta]
MSTLFSARTSLQKLGCGIFHWAASPPFSHRVSPTVATPSAIVVALNVDLQRRRQKSVSLWSSWEESVSKLSTPLSLRQLTFRRPQSCPCSFPPRHRSHQSIPGKLPARLNNCKTTASQQVTRKIFCSSPFWLTLTSPPPTIPLLDAAYWAPEDTIPRVSRAISGVLHLSRPLGYPARSQPKSLAETANMSWGVPIGPIGAVSPGRRCRHHEWKWSLKFARGNTRGGAPERGMNLNCRVGDTGAILELADARGLTIPEAGTGTGRGEHHDLEHHVRNAGEQHRHAENPTNASSHELISSAHICSPGVREKSTKRKSAAGDVPRQSLFDVGLVEIFLRLGVPTVAEQR